MMFLRNLHPRYNKHIRRNFKLQKEPVTAKQYQELYEKWLKEKAESNKKAQEDLANHIQ